MLQGKTAIVTGGSKGIGYEIAKRLCAVGANVAVIARSQEQCCLVAEELRAAGGRASAFCCDLTNLTASEELVERITQTFGGLDILVNNAAWWSNRPFLEVDHATFRRECSEYLESVYFLTQQAARWMLQGKTHGSIINIASTAGLYGEMGMSVYCTAKAAVMNMTRALALELGEYGIRVNAVAPGTTITKDEKRPQEVLEAFRAMASLPSLNTAADIASAVLFFAGPESRGITGQTLAVDGGFRSCMRPDVLYGAVNDRSQKEAAAHG